MNETWEQASHERIDVLSFGGSFDLGPSTSSGAVFTLYNPVVTGTFGPVGTMVGSPSAVPEAPAFALLLVGMACLAGLRAVRGTPR